MVLQPADKAIQKYYSQLGIDIPALVSTLIAMCHGEVSLRQAAQCYEGFIQNKHIAPLLPRIPYVEQLELICHALQTQRHLLEPEEVCQQIYLIFHRLHQGKHNLQWLFSASVVWSKLMPWIVQQRVIQRYLIERYHPELTDQLSALTPSLQTEWDWPTPGLSLKLIFGKGLLETLPENGYWKYVIYLSFVLGLYKSDLARSLLRRSDDSKKIRREARQRLRKLYDEEIE